MAECDVILKVEGAKEEMERYERQMLEMRKPNVWNVYIEGNMERAMEVEGEKLLMAVSEHTNEAIDNINTFRFYALMEYLKEKHKPTK